MIFTFIAMAYDNVGTSLSYFANLYITLFPSITIVFYIAIYILFSIIIILNYKINKELSKDKALIKRKW